jgi:WXG100 family type VII secretion target
MADIHVNTDVMRNLGNLFVQLNEQINYRAINYINSTTSALENDWQGISRQRYEQLIQQWRSATQHVVQTGENLGNHLTQTANQFDNVDRQG